MTTRFTIPDANAQVYRERLQKLRDGIDVTEFTGRDYDFLDEISDEEIAALGGQA